MSTKRRRCIEGIDNINLIRVLCVYLGVIRIIADKVKWLKDVGICIKSTFEDMNGADLEQLLGTIIPAVASR